ncbi:MAG: radical SAM protein [Promethearchaeati archaeon SRVP18_Atabeyarchaeia-1]
MSSELEAPFLKNIGFMLTYKCTISCPHCIVEAGPHRKEEMDLDMALDWVKQASTFRNGHIVGLALTGGEPFYDLEKLAKISEFANSLGFVVSVVTNGFWATTRDVAQKTIARLPAIQMISLSTDTYHRRAIPPQNVKNGIWAAKQLGRLYNIAVCTDNEENPEFKEIINDLRANGEAENTRTAITYPVGRAQRYEGHLNFEIEAEPTVGACTMASSPVVFPDGKVNACIGPVLTLPSAHPLFLGNLRIDRLNDILDRAEMNLFLQTIRVWGPQKLQSLLKEHGLGDLLPREYIKDCICDCCYKLLSDPRIVDALKSILQDEKMVRIIAYARVYYLKETFMAERLDLVTKG